MSRNLLAASKMMYYPTDLKEVYRVAGIISRLSFYSVIKNVLTTEEYDTVSRTALTTGKDIKFCLYDYWVNLGEFEKIDKHFYFSSIGCVALDPFAGEGEWLSTFKKMIGVTTVAVEIDKSRHDKIEADFKLHCAFEDAILPEQQHGLLLFNPPYGETNKVRNVRYYLEMILERDLLTRNAGIIAVIRGDDFLNCFDLFFKNFEIESFYRVNETEFNRYKQFVITGRKKEDLNFSEAQYMADKEHYRKRVEEAAPFNLSDYLPSSWYLPYATASDYRKRLTSAKQIQKTKNQYSSFDECWDWATSEYAPTVASDFELTMARNPKISELATILASGIINGEVADPIAPHVVSAGVKQITQKSLEETEDGATQLKEIRMSRPELNILTIQNGKAVVKSIQGN